MNIVTANLDCLFNRVGYVLAMITIAFISFT